MKTNLRWSSRGVLRSLVCGVALQAISAPAVACINIVTLQTDEGVRFISRAEKELADGNHSQVLSLLSRLDQRRSAGSGFLHGVEYKRERSIRLPQPGLTVRINPQLFPNWPDFHIHNERLKRRVLALYAVATLRSAGVKGRHAFEILDWLQRADPQNPYLIVRRSEAATILGKPGRSRQELEQLLSKDLLPDAESYALLGALRETVGDHNGAALMHAHCLKIAKTPTWQCQALRTQTPNGGVR